MRAIILLVALIILQCTCWALRSTSLPHRQALLDVGRELRPVTVDSTTFPMRRSLRHVVSLRSSFLDADEEERQPPKLWYGALWAGLLTYAATLAPGSSPAATAIDNELILKMVTTPFDGTTNALFVAVFNSLGVLPAIYASLLLPGSKDQKLPALPFVIGGFALGYFAVAPYLAFRRINTTVTSSTSGKGAGAFESKLSAVGVAGFAFYLLYYVLSQGVMVPVEQGGGFTALWQGYADLFMNQKLTHVSSIDATILSLAVWDPLQEDMQRRYTEENPSPLPVWAYCVVPVIGPAAYLLLRPPLPPATAEDQ